MAKPTIPDTSLRDLCRQALHYIETPGDFSDDETGWLRDDLLNAGYKKDENDELVPI